MLWLLLVSVLAGGDALILDDMDDLCGSAGLAVNCDTAEGTWDNPYQVPAGPIDQVGAGCGVTAAIAVCVPDTVVEITGATVSQTAHFTPVRANGPAIFRELTVEAELSGALIANAPIAIHDSTIRAARETAVSALDGLTMTDSLVTGMAPDLLHIQGDGELHRVTLEGGTDETIALYGNTTITSSTLSGARGSFASLAEGTQHRLISVYKDWLVLEDSTLDGLDVAIGVYNRAQLEGQGNHISSGPGQPAIVLANSGEDGCLGRMQYNNIFGPVQKGSPACVYDARHNYWGPSGPPEMDRVRAEPWLPVGIDELPTIQVDEARAEDGGFVIEGRSSKATFVRAVWPNGSATSPSNGTWSLRLEHLSTDLEIAACADVCGAPTPVAVPIHATSPAADTGMSWPVWAAVPIVGTVALAGTTLHKRQQNHRLQRQFDEALQAKESEIAAVRDDLSSFLAGAAHDLRGPIVNLVISTQIAAKRAAAGKDVGKVLGASATSGKRIQQLIDDLMAFGRAGYDAPRLECESLDLTIESVLSSIDTGQARLVVKGTPGMVTLDHVALGRIVQNLVSNAVRADPDGCVAVRWTLAPLTIEVEDQGPGIPDAVRVNLFQPLVKGAAGNGLGLATAKRLAERMGFDLQLVRSDENGTLFRLAAP